MPEIGRPSQGRNQFSKVSMASQAQKARSKQTNGQNSTVGEKLNEMAGAEGEQKFVDRKTHNKLGKDGFLKLLAHQLKNQDPMKPMDQKQFAADLAQFSQLEQLTNMNTKFDKLGANVPSENKFMGASFLGKEVVTKGSSIHYNGQDTRVNVPFYLDKSAKNVIVNVYDSKRQLVSKLEAEDMGKGQHTLTWNGKEMSNLRAGKGDYSFEVFAWDENMGQFKGETKGTGVVSGVRFEGDETILTLENGKEVFLRDVSTFKQPAKQNNAMGQNVQALQKKAASQYNNINESM